MQRSLVILKPEVVQRGLIGEIISRFEKKGLQLIAMKFAQDDKHVLSRHYEDYWISKPEVYEKIEQTMTAGPVVVTSWQGYDAIRVIRTMIGSTNPLQALPGTIRGDFGMSIGKNLIHASDGEDSSEKSIYCGSSKTISFTIQNALITLCIEMSLNFKE